MASRVLTAAMRCLSMLLMRSGMPPQPHPRRDRGRRFQQLLRRPQVVILLRCWLSGCFWELVMFTRYIYRLTVAFLNSMRLPPAVASYKTNSSDLAGLLIIVTAVALVAWATR